MTTNTTSPKITTLRQQRDAKIRAEYFKLFAAGQRSGWIVMDLSGRYFLAQDTVERIVFQRGHYRSAAPVSATASSAGARA